MFERVNAPDYFRHMEGDGKEDTYTSAEDRLTFDVDLGHTTKDRKKLANCL